MQKFLCHENSHTGLGFLKHWCYFWKGTTWKQRDLMSKGSLGMSKMDKWRSLLTATSMSLSLHLWVEWRRDFRIFLDKSQLENMDKNDLDFTQKVYESDTELLRHVEMWPCLKRDWKFQVYTSHIHVDWRHGALASPTKLKMNTLSVGSYESTKYIARTSSRIYGNDRKLYICPHLSLQNLFWLYTEGFYFSMGKRVQNTSKLKENRLSQHSL